MESQTHYIKADPGYGVVHITIVPGVPGLTQVIPVIAWQIKHELITDDDDSEPYVTVTPITILGTLSEREVLGPVVYPDGKVHWSGVTFDSVDDWEKDVAERHGEEE